MIIARLQDTKLIQKSVTLLYAGDEEVEFEIKTIMPFSLVLPKIKYLAINLTKYVQGLDEENNKNLMNEIKNN